MFTGIVEDCVPVRSFEPRGSGARLVLPRPGRADWDAGEGDSIAVCGVCLTVAARKESGMAFDLSAETLARTWFADLAPGRRVNVERALRLGDRLDGHMVAGHVDGGGTLLDVRDVGDGGRQLRFELDSGLERWLIEKGSITLDGVSLTVVEPVARTFTVAAIPLTLQLTNLGSAEPGQRVNVEADLVGKWIEHLLPRP